MKRFQFGYACLLSCLFACSSNSSNLDGNSQYQTFSPDGIPFVVADSLWKANLRGNHRAVVEVLNVKDHNAVEVYLPWRRPDLRADTKKIVVVDCRGNEVKNVSISNFSAESATIFFEPVSGNGLYYVYYLPYKFRKGSGDARYGKPWNDYLPPVYETDEEWENAIGDDAVKAKVLRFESRSRFDAFTPMGLAATQHEMDSIKNIHVDNPILFLEDRAYPIRLGNEISARWAQNGPSTSFKGIALRNEYYTWQIGVWAAHANLNDVKLTFSDLTNGSQIISKDEITCFNQEGTNWDGKPLSFTINVPKNKVQALWCGVQIPEDAKTGIYKGTVTLTCSEGVSKVMPLEIDVQSEVLADKGDKDLWRHSRLRWLNSTIGMDNHPVAPYVAMEVKDRNIKATEKNLLLDKNGLPASIQINNKEVLSSPFRFVVVTNQGEVSFDSDNVVIKQEDDGLVSWSADYTKNGIHFTNKAYMEYDGFVHYDVAVSSEKNMVVKDVRLETTYTSYASEYFMGAGFSGGLRPTNYKSHWNGPWDSYWMGNAKAGLHVELRGGSYHGPLLNDYKPAPPAVWNNSGKGYVQVSGATGSKSLVVASTGVDTLSAKAQNYEFDLLITPVKPLNTAQHFYDRYYHAPHTGFDKAAEEGANVCNIHHAQKLNPVINYPFIVQDSLKAFINHEHEYGRRVKLYYTIRELTNYTTEIFALKSLNHEILAKGVGYGLPWQCEHMIDDYKPAWYTEFRYKKDETADAAFVLSGFSRWINYYLEGLRWMLENYKIDGIYMDDVSFDRPVMKRMRKILDKYRPGAIIDLHSNTGYSKGPANQYTGFFPYVNRLWFGESFRYNKMRPDEWFVTFSGVPFGQMSEMLQDGGNRFLGMVYGTTARHSYGAYSPAPVWKLWKEFGIEDAKMLGYWDDECPVSVSGNAVKATAYVKNDKMLISVGNFSEHQQAVQVTIDWKKLGWNKDNVKVYLPAVKDFQLEKALKYSDKIAINAKEGVLIIIESK